MRGNWIPLFETIRGNRGGSTLALPEKIKCLQTYYSLTIVKKELTTNILETHDHTVISLPHK